MTIHTEVVIPRGAEALFRSLSDPSRLAIITCLVHGEHRVTDLMSEVGLSQSTVSEHVSCLKDCGLVQGRHEGRQIFYSLAHEEVLTLLDAASNVLAATGYAVDECPTYGRTARVAARREGA
ncbi:MAG: metalloregulator ArsR/SmtB family transcription factor [Propionibacteriaceae bacterium]|jgi:ArsR family transcriptional regulator|nr:metalloregulator ArsR/SmtB family transcription factor [Propionibacteriaceae bacterium]